MFDPIAIYHEIGGKEKRKACNLPPQKKKRCGIVGVRFLMIFLNLLQLSRSRTYTTHHCSPVFFLRNWPGRAWQGREEKGVDNIQIDRYGDMEL